MTKAEIDADSWHHRGHELLALLGHADAAVRSAAAVRIGELLGEPELGLPDRAALFDILRERDAEHPGVADAFWTTVVFGSPLDDTFGYRELQRWMLAVLEARRDRRRPLSPVPGNDLEFYAHETLDRDFEALSRLLDAGYVNVVENALAHDGALPRDSVITLLRRLFALAPQRWHVEGLAVCFGVILDEASSFWPRVNVAGASALLFSRDHGSRRLWTVHWLLFEPPFPNLAQLPDDQLLTTLAAAGLVLDPLENSLDPKAIQHISFPQLARAARRVCSPRVDLQIDLAVTEAGEVAALRVVRARATEPEALAPRR